MIKDLGLQAQRANTAKVLSSNFSKNPRDAGFLLELAASKYRFLQTSGRKPPVTWAVLSANPPQEGCSTITENRHNHPTDKTGLEVESLATIDTKHDFFSLSQQ